MAELEQQRDPDRVDHRNGTGKVQARLAVDAELELLLGIGRAVGERLVDCLKERRRVAKEHPRGIAEQLTPRNLEQVLGGGICITDLERFVEQQHCGREKFQAGIGCRRVIGG